MPPVCVSNPLSRMSCFGINVSYVSFGIFRVRFSNAFASFAFASLAFASSMRCGFSKEQTDEERTDEKDRLWLSWGWLVGRRDSVRL